MELIRLLLAVLLTAEQVFDVFSTTVALNHVATATEGDPAILWLMKTLGHWWWIIKLPVVLGVWYDVIWRPETFVRISVPLSASIVDVPVTTFTMIGLALIYVYVLYNNYKIAWGQ